MTYLQFDEEMLTAVLLEVSAMNECSRRNDCSEIKGLEHRLFKLAQMMDESKRLAEEQYNLAEVGIFNLLCLKESSYVKLFLGY